jgi:sulfur-carrier protein
MATVVFAPALQRHVPLPPQVAEGATVRAVLDAALSGNARARGYILDDQNALRHHMIIFVDGVKIRDRIRLSDPVGENSSIFVFQSLSGG